MSIDERLERLAERQEALARSIESTHRDWEARFGQIGSTLERDGEYIQALVRPAERRLSHLEGGE
jgi:hypothetical protein